MRSTMCAWAGLVTGLAAAANAESLAERYQAVAQKLITAALADSHSTDRLEYLCDRIGNRLSGSASLERAIEWSAEEMRKAGLENVQTPPVTVPTGCAARSPLSC